MRPGVLTRTARVEDVTELVSLCLEARAELMVGAQLCTDDPVRLREQLLMLLNAPGGVIVVATLDERVDGLLLARIVGPGPFTDAVVLTLESLYVRHSARRRGLGHALLLAAVEIADQAGALEVFASPLPGARGMHRFLAQAGFAPAAAHRVVTTAALARRLTQDPVTSAGAGRRPSRHGLEDLIARRRQARAREEDPLAPVAATGTHGARQSRMSISMQVTRAVQSRRPPSSSTVTS